MLFSSVLFLFYFLPAFLLVYFLVPEKYKNIVLLLFSIFIYAFSVKSLIVVLFISIILNYSLGLMLNNKYKNTILISGVSANLVILGVFKYYDFFINNINVFFQFIHLRTINTTLSFLLPVGISFYTLQNISYLVDVYRDEIKAERNFIRFSTFIFMFPKIIIGPIERYSNLQGALLKKEISLENFNIGIRRFIIGLAKKVIIADNLNYTINTIFHLSPQQLSISEAWLGIVFFAVQIYYDFSGYTDMAIGLGKMCGFTIMENFNFPYISQSIQEFWQRWHISFSSWLADYVFRPIQFNLRDLKMAGGMLSILITFFISGLWHGASWNFIAWGLFHGIFLGLEFSFLKKILKKNRPIVSHIYALLVINTGWVFFRTENLSQAFLYLQRMFTPSFSSNSYISAAKYLTCENTIALIIGVIFAAPVTSFIKKAYFPQKTNMNLTGVQQCIYSIALFAIFIISIMYLSVQAYKPFIYGGF